MEPQLNRTPIDADKVSWALNRSGNNPASLKSARVKPGKASGFLIRRSKVRILPGALRSFSFALTNDIHRPFTTRQEMTGRSHTRLLYGGAPSDPNGLKSADASFSQKKAEQGIRGIKEA
jgi:hypothetical protein